MTVNKNSEHVEEAGISELFLHNNTEAQETLKDVRSIPPTSTARQLCADKDLHRPWFGCSGFGGRGLTRQGIYYQRRFMQDMIESIAYGQSTPEEAADNAIELINDYLSGLN